MKKVRYVCAIIMAINLTMVSCSKDSSGSGGGDIVGNWELKYYSEVFVDSSTTPPTRTYQSINYIAGKVFVEYKSDKTYIASDYSFGTPPDIETGTYTTSGGKLTSFRPGLTVTADYIASADSLKLIFEDNFLADLHIGTYTYVRK